MPSVGVDAIHRLPDSVVVPFDYLRKTLTVSPQHSGDVDFGVPSD